MLEENSNGEIQNNNKTTNKERLSYADVAKMDHSLDTELNLSMGIMSNLSPELIPNEISVDDPWKVQSNSTVNISSIFANVNLPLSFERTFKLALPDEDNQITVAALDKIISSCGLPKATSNKILFLVLGMNQTHISRNELFVILGLIGLAQKNMDVTIENLELYKHDLPEPSLSGLESINFHSLRKLSNKQSSNGINDPWRTSQRISVLKSENIENNGSISSYGKSTKVGSSKSKNGLGDTQTIEDDVVIINIAEEMGGIIFKYVNYKVTSKVRNCTVIRRYSDFYWLSELLYKRYPYRMLPTLPPKKFGGNKAFFDERRIGLSRFINFLVVHPVLKEDSMVNVFLTEPLDIATYRSENTVHTFEEFKFTRFKFDAYKLNDESIEERKLSAKKSLDFAIHQYNRICLTLKKITLRQHASGKDFILLGQALSSLSEQETKTSDQDPLNIVPVFGQYKEIASYIDKAASILMGDADKLDAEALEGFRSHHLNLIALKELFERIESQKSLSCDQLKERILKQQNEIDSMPNDSVNQIEAQRIQALINSDEKLLKEEEKRYKFINHCLWSELEYFHTCHRQVMELYKHFVQLELDHHIQLSRVWKNLSNVVDLLPTTISQRQLNNETASMSPQTLSGSILPLDEQQN